MLKKENGATETIPVLPERARSECARSMGAVASSLDQCVTGRGTQTLTVRCSQTQPYSGQRDY